ncbi:MAG: hypothetical protein JKY56_18645 [Kofleriaceae bacterium]|nr:hypothetical protein [Kofleriaceae bacterium]
MGNSKKLKQAHNLVRSGTAPEDAAKALGVSLTSLQARIEKAEADEQLAQRTLLKRRIEQLSDDDLVHWNELLESGLNEAAAIKTLCTWPELITESEANARFETKAKLVSHGELGCHVLVVPPQAPSNVPDCCWMCDTHYFSLVERFGCGYDIGTIIIDGDLTLKREANISDRLMCLVVAGSLRASEFNIFETEVCIYGDLKLEVLSDYDDLLTVHGRREVQSVID